MLFLTPLAQHIKNRRNERERSRIGTATLVKIYKETQQREPNYFAPKRFSEFMLKRLIETNTYGNPRYTRLADKALVRHFVCQKIGKQYLVPLIWQGANAAEIPFGSLPPNCIIKTNNGSGGHIKTSSISDHFTLIDDINSSLSRSHYQLEREMMEYHYGQIKRQIIIEQTISDGYEYGPLDYRFFCFGGEPRLIQVDDNAHRINPFYDIRWQKLDLKYRAVEDADVPRPPHLNEMLHVARALSEEFDFVRVDLYDTPNGIFFGEMTFTPTAGQMKFAPDRWDEILGSYWSEARDQLAKKARSSSDANQKGTSLSRLLRFKKRPNLP